jgi:beta-mannosidase
VTLPHQQIFSGRPWTVRPVGDLSHVPAGIAGRVIAATVPGCIHTDLIDAGAIRDPRIGDAESEVLWVSWTDWRYELEFDAEPSLFERDEIDLVFDHLDTIATIELNGVKVGKAMSEFLPWRFSVRGVLRPGRNHLAVTFTSPLRYVKEEAARLGPRPVNGDYPAYNMIRKCASSFEWDWGPRVATCGIAGDVRLEAWNDVRIASIGTRAKRTATKRWDLAVDIGLQWARRQHTGEIPFIGVSVTGTFEGILDRSCEVLTEGVGSITLELELDPVDCWHPFTHGGQPGYTLNAWTAHGEVASPFAWRYFGRQHSQPIAFRDVSLDSSPDDLGDRFSLALDGGPVYCRGANWIPEGLFPRDRTPERVRERLKQLKDANMNMIRVWGGGRYEPDWFYDLCDELGIMVWQDFMFACASYPEEEPIRSLVEQEARYHVARLARHPSVVLWCGGNECEWAHESWGFKEKLAPGQTWGEKYYREILPRICAEVNPSVPYIPNSPFSPKPGLHPNDPSHGDTHTWDVWGDGYRTVTPRFCSEFGQQGPSDIATLTAAGLAPAPGDSAMVPALLAARQRGPGGNKRWYDDPIAAWFRPPRDFDEWHYLAQLVQARSLQIGIEWQRANMREGGCMGSLIWQLNDAWPGLSWSLIDADGRPKLAYHAVAAAFKNRRFCIQPTEGRLRVIAINDSDETWSGQLRIRRMSFEGVVFSDSSGIGFSVERRSVRPICGVEDAVGPPSHPDREFVVTESLTHRAFWYYLPDRALRYPAPAIDAGVTVHHGHESTFTLSSTALVRDAVLNIDRVIKGATIHAPPPYTILPGEKLVLAVRVPPSVADPSFVEAKLREPGVIMCANHFGKPTGA